MEKLRFVKFSELNEWSVLSLSNNGIRYSKSYPLKSIGLFLNQITNSVKIEDSIEYKQITVKTNNGGLVLRDIKLGKDIGTKKQNKVNTGQFLMSRIDARNGAMGIVPESLSGAVVTNDFPIFNVKTNEINPQYLVLLTTTTYFKKVAQNCSSGTTNRQRIDVKKFLAQRIPLPTLEQQNKIVDSYNQCVAMSASKEAKANEIEREIERYLMDELGISNTKMYETNSASSFEAHEPSVEYVVNITKKQDDEATYHWGDEIKKEYSKLQFVSFKDLEEWGVDKIVKKNNIRSQKYSVKKVKDICSLGSGGTPSRSKSQYYNGDIPWVKTGEVINQEIFETEEHITKEAIQNSSAKLYHKGSLIIAMYGQGDTRGRTAKLGIDAATNQACAVLYNIDNKLVLTDYLWYYFQGCYNDLRSLASGNNQPNLNAGKINNYEVVLPPLDIQNAIVSHITELKEQIKNLKKEAKELREKALKEFEKEVFE